MREACASDIAPTTSTTLMLALGDALAVAVMEARGTTRSELRSFHPGGSIGHRLTRVEDVMHRGERLPLVLPDAAMSEVLIEMSHRRLGIAGVVDRDGDLIGVITDGDLRRHSSNLWQRRAADIMSAQPKSVRATIVCEEALATMRENRITSLFVTDAERPQRPIGLVQIYDLDLGAWE